jgi:hypothetical protein
MEKFRIDITDWKQTEVKPRSPSNRISISSVYLGVLFTLALHGLIFRTVWIESAALTGVSQSLRNCLQCAANATGPADLIVFQLPGIFRTTDRIDTPQISEAIKSASRRSRVIDDIDPPPIDTLEIDEASNQDLASIDAATNAQLFKLYIGQVRARIERVWKRPRSPIFDSNDLRASDDTAFQCQTQLEQDTNGIVQEVLLRSCSGTAAWKESLLTAIRGASPLPAPPNANLFSKSLAVTFIGVPYTSAAIEDEYESLAVRR